MSNNEQDDKIVNNRKEKQKDSHDLQVLNTIGSIIAQITTNNPNELRRLVSQAQGLKSDNPRIQDIIEKVQSIITKKQEAAEERINSEISQEESKKLEELEKQRQQALQLQIHEEALERKKQNFKDLSYSLHASLDESIQNTTERHALTQNIHNDFKEGKLIDEEKLKITEISSKEEIEELKQIYEERKKLEAEYAAIKKEQISLKQAIEEKAKKINSSLTQEENTKLHEELNLDKEKLRSYVPVLKEFKNIIQSVDQKIEVRKQLLNKEEAINIAIAKTLSENKNINPEKYKKYEQHYKVLQEQHTTKKEIIEKYEESLQLEQKSLSKKEEKEEKQKNSQLPIHLVNFIQKCSISENKNNNFLPNQKANKDKGIKR